MKFINQNIKGLYLIVPEGFKDKRGMLRRHFCHNQFKKKDINFKIKQTNISENYKKYTLRGFHYQVEPYSEGKTLSCLKGSIFDIVVDLRKDSPTYMDWIPVELNEQNRTSVHIAPGCANAFLTLEDNCLIHYYCSAAYKPEAERGIRFDDPSFNFNWPLDPKIISDKDLLSNSHI